MLLKFIYLRCYASLFAAGIVCGYMPLVTTMIAVACSQFDKLKATILDVRQQHITPQYRHEDEQVDIIANCDLQAKLNACIRHHQNTLE